MLEKIKASLNSTYLSVTSRIVENMLNLVISLVVGHFFGALIGIFFWLLVLCIINQFSSKFLIISGLFLLIAIPISMISGEVELSSKIAVVTYYILLVVVVLEIWTYYRPHQFKKSNTSPSAASILESVSEPVDQTILGQKTVTEINPRHKSLEFSRSLKTTPPTVILKTTMEQAANDLNNQHSQDASVNKLNFRSLIQKFHSMDTQIQEDKPKISFHPNQLFKYWNFYVFGISFILPVSIFRFLGLPSFRDITTVPYFYNINKEPFDLSAIQHMIFNVFTRILSPELISSIYFQLSFFIGSILTYLFLSKIQSKFSTNITFLNSNLNKLFILVVSLLYVYNPFTFERFLMGQHFVLQGHLFFIPVLYYLIKFLDVFLNARKEDFRLLNHGNISVFTSFCWSLTLMALVSTHHALFTIYLSVAGLVFIFILRFKLAVDVLKKISIAQSAKHIGKILAVLILIILPSIIIFINRYTNTSQQSTFYKQRTDQADYERKIVSSFSLKVLDDQNLVQKALIGAASWNTPGFAETNNIAVSLGSIRKLTTYFSPKLNLILIVAMIALLGYCGYLADRFYKPIILPFFVLLPFVLILNFGYSLNFEGINSLFFKLPFSYALREPGKFYSLFLALLCLIFVVYSEYFIKKIHKISIFFFTLILFGNILIFLPLSQNITYASYPNIYKEVSQICNDLSSPKVLFLPFNTYIYPSYSSTFTANFSPSLLDCDVVAPDYTTLENRDTKNKNSDPIELSTSKKSSSINGIISTFTKTTDSVDTYENLKKELKIFGIEIIVVDDTKYSDISADDLGVFNKKLQRYLPPEKVDKDDEKSISVYIIR